MCDRILIWNGPEVDEIDGNCLCVASQERIWGEIIKMAIESKLLPLTIDQQLVIEHDPFGYIVRVESAPAQQAAQPAPQQPRWCESCPNLSGQDCTVKVCTRQPREGGA